jgi:hypothetical protein
MPLNILFWVIYLIALLVAWWGYYEAGKPWFRPFGSAIALWLLVGILGWKVFGAAVR